jgi:mediator of RNA polymerase II transcription subunit 12
MTELCKSFFDGSASPYSATLDQARFEEKVFILCNWAMGLFNLGGHRPYAVGTLLRLWHDERDRYLSKNPSIKPIDLFVPLYNWLDGSLAARRAENVLAVGITFGEFTRSGLFSYGRYLQSLIACGHTARLQQGPSSHHLALLRAMPIFVEAEALLEQRRLALCGDDPAVRQADKIQEEEAMEAYKEEIREYIPEVFGYSRSRHGGSADVERYGRSSALRESIEHRLVTPISLTRYLFLQARFWLSPACHEHLKS